MNNVIIYYYEESCMHTCTQLAAADVNDQDLDKNIIVLKTDLQNLLAIIKFLSLFLLLALNLMF